MLRRDFGMPKRKIISLVGLVFAVVLVGLGLFLVRNYVANVAMQKGNQNFNQNNYELAKAEKWYKVASIVMPKYSQAHYQLGRVYFVEGKLDKAVSEFDMTLHANPDHKRAYYMRGLAKGYKKDYAGSQADFQSFLDNFPDEWAGYVDLAWVYYEDGQYEKAREVAEKGLELFPENAWVLKGLGVAYIQLGEKDKAREVLEKALAKAEKLTVSDWQFAYPGNDPAGAKTNLAIFKNDIQEAIFSSKSVLAMEKPKYTSACAASSINICSGASCVVWNYCDGDSSGPLGGYHSNLFYVGDYTYGSLTPPEQLCSRLTPPAPVCYSNADCCAPSCATSGSYCTGTPFPDGCGGTCWGTKICDGICSATAIGSYSAVESFPRGGSLCANGTPDSSPVLGSSSTTTSTVSWHCLGVSGGASSPLCVATRVCVPTPGVFDCIEDNPNYCTTNIKTTCGTESPWHLRDTCGTASGLCKSTPCASCTNSNWREVAP
jgi:tetratricopeptide (TPR) repeat protein